MARVIERLTEDAGRLLRSVEARRVLGFDEVEVELRAAMETAGGGEFGVAFGPPRRWRIGDEPDERGWRLASVQWRLDLADPGLEFVAAERRVSGGARHIFQDQHREADPLVGQAARSLEAPSSACGNRRRPRRPGVNAVAPQLEPGMLRLQGRCAGVLVGPVAKSDLVVVGLDLVDLEALRPGKDEPLSGTLKSVLDMELVAHEGAHLPAGRLLVTSQFRMLAKPRRADTFDESGTGDAQRQRCSIVAVDAGDRVLHELDRLAVGHRVDLLEALDDVSFAGFLVGI